MSTTKALIGSALLAATAAGIIPACSMEPQPCGGLQDYSNPSAPKVIRSKDIIAFTYTFENRGAAFPTLKSRGDYYATVAHDDPYRGRCTLQLTKNGGKADFVVSCSGESQEGGFNAKGTVGLEAFDELQAIIDQENVARLNGFYKRNTALGNYFNLKINYASGESITAGGEGGFAVIPDGGLPEQSFKALFSKLVTQTGQALPSIYPPADTISRLELKFVNNHPEAGFPAGLYLLQYLHIENREYACVSLVPADGGEKRMFDMDLTKQEVKALQALIVQENLLRLSGYTVRKPDLGDQPFRVEVAFANRQVSRAEAVGDESVLPSKYWTNGKPFVAFFGQAAKKRGKTFP